MTSSGQESENLEDIQGVHGQGSPPALHVPQIQSGDERGAHVTRKEEEERDIADWEVHLRTQKILPHVQNIIVQLCEKNERL